jgi:hypothetical protein
MTVVKLYGPWAASGLEPGQNEYTVWKVDPVPDNSTVSVTAIPYARGKKTRVSVLGTDLEQSSEFGGDIEYRDFQIGVNVKNVGDTKVESYSIMISVVSYL